MTVRHIADKNMFAGQFNVSRETLDRLKTLEGLLTKWNKTINLVSPSTIKDIWHRHFADSAQLYQHMPSNALNCLDIGSGAGFPALVLAILSKENQPNRQFTLVESDQRKCAFLLNAANALDLNITVLPQRIEALPDQKFDLITARALSSLTNLLEMTHRFTDATTISLFPKGIRHESELTEACKIWHIREQKIPSITDKEAVVLRIESYSRA